MVSGISVIPYIIALALGMSYPSYAGIWSRGPARIRVAQRKILVLTLLMLEYGLGDCEQRTKNTNQWLS